LKIKNVQIMRSIHRLLPFCLQPNVQIGAAIPSTGPETNCVMNLIGNIRLQLEK